MKTRNLLMLTATLVIIFHIPVQAQPGQGRQQNPSPNTCMTLGELTTGQQTQIQNLRTARLEETTSFRAQMNELRARKQSMQIAEKPDMNQINTIIDQMAQLRAQQQKASAAHRQSIREILTPEQRAQFDARAQHKPRMEQRAGRRGGPGRYRN